MFLNIFNPNPVQILFALREAAMISNQENASSEGFPENIMEQLPERLRRFSEPELAEIRWRFDQIGKAPHPGKVARKIRKRKGMTIEEVAEEADVNPSHVDLFEKSGDIRRSSCRWMKNSMRQRFETIP